MSKKEKILKDINIIENELKQLLKLPVGAIKTNKLYITGNQELIEIPVKKLIDDLFYRYGKCYWELKQLEEEDK